MIFFFFLKSLQNDERSRKNVTLAGLRRKRYIFYTHLGLFSYKERVSRPLFPYEEIIQGARKMCSVFCQGCEVFFPPNTKAAKNFFSDKLMLDLNSPPYLVPKTRLCR